MKGTRVKYSGARLTLTSGGEKRRGGNYYKPSRYEPRSRSSRVDFYAKHDERDAFHCEAEKAPLVRDNVAVIIKADDDYRTLMQRPLEICRLGRTGIGDVMSQRKLTQRCVLNMGCMILLDDESGGESHVCTSGVVRRFPFCGRR